MGMYDSVTVSCNKCKQDTIEFQTKVGDCMLRDFSSDSVPMEIALALDGTSESCRTCGHTVTLYMPMRIDKVCMVVKENYV